MRCPFWPGSIRAAPPDVEFGTDRHQRELAWASKRQSGRGGALAICRLAAEPANLVGRLMLATRFFRSAGKTFGKLAGEANAFANGAREAPFTYEAPPATPEVAARIDRMVTAIEQSGNG